MSVVIGIRISRKLKEELEELGINYAEEIRRYLERRVREEKARQILNEIEKLKKEIGKVDGNLAVEFIREDRDER